MAETGLNQNWNRDYDPLTGKYIESDPIGLKGGLGTYAYVFNSPVMGIDPSWLAKICCRLLDDWLAGGVFAKRHCYIIADDGTKYALYPESGQGVPRTNDGRDRGGDCYDCPGPDCGNQNQCLRKAFSSYPVGYYFFLGPNSNTFAGTLARSCCKGGVPAAVHDAPGINGSPPPPGPTKAFVPMH